MEAVELSVSELGEKLAGYVESRTPLAIMRMGETVGYYIPAQKRDFVAARKAIREAGEVVDKMIEGLGLTEEQLMAEYKVIRDADRQKRRNGS